MGNLIKGIQRFITNKNTVTILAVFAGIIVLWYFYNDRVDSAISTIAVPYSTVAIDSGKKIELDNVETKELTQSSIKDSDIITSQSQLEGKYVCVGTSVPQNGFFYQSQLCEGEALPNSILENIEDGYTLYNLKVNNELTYANSILPGDYIDLYMSAVTEDRKVVYGKLIESIEVYKVTDSSGRDVFWDTSAGDSAFLIFAVPDEFHRVLELSELVGQSVEITPVPRSASYSENPGATVWGSNQLKQIIENQAAQIVG